MLYFILILWIIGIPVTYGILKKVWNDKSKGENIYYSIIWPTIVLLASVRFIQKKLQ